MRARWLSTVPAESRSAIPSPAPDKTVKKTTLSGGFTRCSRSALHDAIDERLQPPGEARAGGRVHRDLGRRPRRKIPVHRLVAELREHCKPVAAANELRHRGRRIVEIAEEARVRRAREHAGRLAVLRRQE